MSKSLRYLCTSLAILTLTGASIYPSTNSITHTPTTIHASAYSNIRYAKHCHHQLHRETAHLHHLTYLLHHTRYSSYRYCALKHNRHLLQNKINHTVRYLKAEHLWYHADIVYKEEKAQLAHDKRLFAQRQHQVQHIAHQSKQVSPRPIHKSVTIKHHKHHTKVSVSSVLNKIKATDNALNTKQGERWLKHKSNTSSKYYRDYHELLSNEHTLVQLVGNSIIPTIHALNHLL